MSYDHNDVAYLLGLFIGQQIDLTRFLVRVNAGQVRRRDRAASHISDVFVLPAALGAPFRGQTGRLEVYDAPLPLVIEVWSPSPGGYGVDAKIPTYRDRGDLEIWRVHPPTWSITIWRRQPDGGYVEQTVTAGAIAPAAFPNVVIEIARLFGGSCPSATPGLPNVRGFGLGILPRLWPCRAARR